MRLIKSRIKSAFSRSAFTYDGMSDVQNSISDKMIEYLDGREFHRVLEIGSGTGSYTEKLIKLNKNMEFVLIDFAGPMIKAAKKKLSEYESKITFLSMDAEKISRDLFPENHFDLVTSSSTLQWISGLDELFVNIFFPLSPGGIFLFSYFGPDTYKELNWVLEEYYGPDEASIPAVGFLSKKEISSLVKKRFHKVKIREYRVKKEYKDLYCLLSRIRQCGEYGYGIGKQMRLTRRDLKEIEKIYMDKFNKIIATSHYYIISSCKKQEK